MSRIKIDYGIDLGTTNSAIARIDKGEPHIIRTDLLKDTMPSCVAFNKRRSVMVGDSALNTLRADGRRATRSWSAGSANAFVEFKRTMGTDTLYHSAYMDADYTSEQLSAEVLKMLRSFVSDERVDDVVITVPAKFTVIQKTATMEAARLAGFRHVELLQEPVAAAFAYSLTSPLTDGLWMAFDFGGGTFDAALLRVEDGVVQVFDTEGDNYLGGKNLDYAIVDEIIIPYLRGKYRIDPILADHAKKAVLRDALKTYAEALKNQLTYKPSADILSDLGDLGEDCDGEELELELTVTRDEAFAVMRPHVQKAIDICLDLLERNTIPATRLDKLILIRGPTLSPLIRAMLAEQVTPNVDTSVDPMTTVAIGAAIYAATIDADGSGAAPSRPAIDADGSGAAPSRHAIDADGSGAAPSRPADTTVRLELGFEATSVAPSEWVTVKLADDRPAVMVELVSADGAWASGKTRVDTAGAIVEATLRPARNNTFEVRVTGLDGTPLEATPAEFSIIQGTKVSAAPLPYNIGIAVWSGLKGQEVFHRAVGLEKNKPLPCTGIVRDLHAPDRLRPGVADDRLVIPVYQVDDCAQAQGRRASLYEHVADVTITGDDIDAPIQRDALANLTLKVDTSEQMTLEVHFPATDQTVIKPLDTSRRQSIADAKRAVDEGIAAARTDLDRLYDEGVDVEDLRTHLAHVENEAANSSEYKATLQHVKELLRRIDAADSDAEWDRVDNLMSVALGNVQFAHRNINLSPEAAVLVHRAEQRVAEARRRRNPRFGREVIRELDNIYYRLTRSIQLRLIIDRFSQDFATTDWTDPERARRVIDSGVDLVAANAPDDQLAAVVNELERLVGGGPSSRANHRFIL